MTRAPRMPRLWRVTNDEYRGALLEEIVTTPETAMARGRVLKHDGTTTVTLVEDGERHWVIKRYNTKNRWHAVRRLLRTSRAVNCWHAAGWFAAAGIPTPLSVAAVEERYARFLRGRSYFVCEFIEGETLDRALRHDRGVRAALIDEAAGIVHRLRDRGIVHGDLKATNFIVTGDRLVLVDLDASRRGSGHRIAAGQQKDLRRFLKNWADQPELLREFEKRLIG